MSCSNSDAKVLLNQPMKEKMPMVSVYCCYLEQPLPPLADSESLTLLLLWLTGANELQFIAVVELS